MNSLAELKILLIIRDSTKFQAEIKIELDEISCGKIDPGFLSRIMNRMVHSGAIFKQKVKNKNVARNYYTITKKGLASLSFLDEFFPTK